MCVALLVGATILVTVTVLVMEGNDPVGVGAELKLGVRKGGIKLYRWEWVSSYPSDRWWLDRVWVDVCRMVVVGSKPVPW